MSLKGSFLPFDTQPFIGPDPRGDHAQIGSRHVQLWAIVAPTQAGGADRNSATLLHLFGREKRGWALCLLRVKTRRTGASPGRSAPGGEADEIGGEADIAA